MLYKSIWVGNDFFFTPKDHFSDTLVKKLDSGWSSQKKKILFSIPIPKIKFDPPPQWKIALVFIS